MGVENPGASTQYANNQTLFDGTHLQNICSSHWCLPVCHAVLLSRACLVKASALNPTCINAQSHFLRTKRRHRRLCFARTAGNLADRISMWKGCTNAACPFAGNWRCEPTDPYKFLPLSQFRYRLDDAGFARTRSGQSQGKHPQACIILVTAAVCVLSGATTSLAHRLLRMLLLLAFSLVCRRPTFLCVSFLFVNTDLYHDGSRIDVGNKFANA
eukprot:COSAG06_NODE_6194_length_3052_cov_1.899560_3_plen_214_part_00